MDNEPLEFDLLMAVIELLNSLSEADSLRSLLSFYEQRQIRRRRWT